MTSAHPTLTRLQISAALLLMLAAHPAQAATTLYAQNFNSPASTPCTAWGGAGSASSLSTDYSGNGQVGTAAFMQIGTADRICWGQGTTPVLDPAGTAGIYSGGFARNGAITESWAIDFDPQGRPFINGQIDLAHITPGNLDGIGQPTNYPGTATSVPMALRFFRVPMGVTFTLQDAGGGIPANVLVGGTPLVPLAESGTVTITKSTAFNRYSADWNTHPFSVDTSAFASGDRLVLVGTVVNNLTYIVFDNLTITAADAATQAPGISKQFGATQVTPGDTTSLTINVAGNNAATLQELAVTDALPAPLTLTGTVHGNTCGGTLDATAGASQLTLADGTLPVDGCQIQVDVQWPASAIDSCSGSAITNTIRDGTDFTVGSTATAGLDANAQLTCAVVPPPAITPKPVPVTHPFGLLLAAMTLAAAVTRRRARAQAQ